jgi:hypothetical protein
MRAVVADPKAGISADINTTYQTQLRDMFASGLAAEIGPYAFGVWHAVKSHADFATGEAYPGVRRLMLVTGQASGTVQKALATLKAAHLLRISRRVGQRIYYIARERLDLRIGGRAIGTIVVDYVPIAMRERLAKLKAATAGELEAQDVWDDVQIIPSDGFVWDPESRALKRKVQPDEPSTPVPPVPIESMRTALDGDAATDDASGIERARALADEIRKGKRRRRP